MSALGSEGQPSRAVSRRQLLRHGAVGASVLYGAGFMAACGEEEKAASVPEGKSSATKKATGPLRGGTIPPYDSSVPAGSKPELPKRVGYSLPGPNDYFTDLQKGMRAGLEDRGVELVTAVAEGDPSKQASQFESFLARGVGALLISPTDPKALKPIVMRAIESGVAVLGDLMAPCTQIGNINQYSFGKAAAEVLVKYVQQNFDGKGNVLVLNADVFETLKPKHQGMLAGLKTGGPNIKVVADIGLKQITSDAAGDATSTALQAHPEINAIIGCDDGAAAGALAALKAAGKTKANSFVMGGGGLRHALELIRDGNSPLAADLALATPVHGYAWAQHAADWLEGKSIPQAVDFPVVPLSTNEEIDTFLADMENPGPVWKDPKYLKFYGNVSYDTKGNYVDFVWSPEA